MTAAAVQEMGHTFMVLWLMTIAAAFGPSAWHWSSWQLRRIRRYQRLRRRQRAAQRV